MKRYPWTIGSVIIVTVIGLINRLAPLTQEGYLDRQPSLSRDLVYARRIAGEPLPLAVAMTLLLFGIMFWVIARRTRLSGFLRLLGFICILGAWAPYAALALMVILCLLLLSWVVGGMGTQSEREIDPGSNAMSAEEGHALWNNFVHPSSEQHRKHIRWAFIICWAAATMLAVIYSQGVSGWYINFPDPFSTSRPTILWVVELLAAPVFLGALFELVWAQQSGSDVKR